MYWCLHQRPPPRSGNKNLFGRLGRKSFFYRHFTLFSMCETSAVNRGSIPRDVCRETISLPLQISLILPLLTHWRGRFLDLKPLPLWPWVFWAVSFWWRNVQNKMWLIICPHLEQKEERVFFLLSLKIVMSSLQFLAELSGNIKLGWKFRESSNFLGYFKISTVLWMQSKIIEALILCISVNTATT